MAGIGEVPAMLFFSYNLDNARVLSKQRSERCQGAHHEGANATYDVVSSFCSERCQS
jgi:hypothetical protein